MIIARRRRNAQASTYCTAGAIYFEQKQFEKALKCFAKVIPGAK